MDVAINKTTNKPISAFTVYKDGSYQNLDRGEWIAPQDSIGNWENITDKDKQVHYVGEKEYTNYNGTEIWCSPHFAVYPNSLAITKPIDPAHKKLQEWLFNRLANDDLELYYSKGTKPHKYENKIKLSELDINWNDYGIEITTKSFKKLRADIILPFNKRHNLLGEGIFFEIQLSSQNKEVTYSRSIERTLHGYSTCWLFEKDFIIEEDNIQLKNNLVKINSFSEEIHYAKKGFVGKLKEVVEEQCRFLDNKIAETNNQNKNLDKKHQEILESLKTNAEYFQTQIQNNLKTREAVLIKKIEALEQNPFASLIETYKLNLADEFDILMKRYRDNNQNLDIVFKEMVKKLNYPLTFGECNQCHQGYMAFKKTKTGKEVYSCSNYQNGAGCKNTVWLN